MTRAMKKLSLTALALAVATVLAGATATPSTAAPSAPQIGSCRWQCAKTAKWYSTASACSAACAGSTCEAIC